MGTLRDWQLLGTPPGAVAGPDALPAGGWRPAVLPGTPPESAQPTTVAAALGVPLDAPGDLDGQDWWYRATIDWGTTPPGLPCRLRFEGLATLVEGWLDGAPLLTSEDMFVPREVPVRAPASVGTDPRTSTLVLAFRSVSAECARRKPRPRWKTALVEQQNLRWIRASLVGRIPGWTPAVPAIGPWRPVSLTVDLGPPRAVARVQASVDDGVPTLRAWVTAPPGWNEERAAILFVDDRRLAELEERRPGLLYAKVARPDFPKWWPHTHGRPNLVAWKIEAPPRRDRDGTWGAIGEGRVGFRTVSVDRSDGGVRVSVNGREVFCRGACWTPTDVRRLDGDPAAVRASVGLAREAGANLLRVGGTMTWESEAFYDACDEAGLLVWQDLPLANMDYPFGDAAFAAAVDEELRHHLPRLATHPSVAFYCGGSEIEQQAAMMGIPPEEGTGPFFREHLPARVEELHPGAHVFPSTPTGGALPFHTRTGLTHYYGVGAYQRPLTDARRAGVRFTPECLGFANVPSAEATEAAFGTPSPAPHLPAWKAGVPRDNGAGWDFEDIRDHYLRELYGVDPARLRYADLPRYHALSREVTGELMHRVYAEWRRPGSGCGGALVWFWRDLRPGAGWGVLDDQGRPKPAWWALRRAWASRTVQLTDEGLDGLDLHVHNEHREPLHAVVELELYRDARQRVAEARAEVTLLPFTSLTLGGDALLGRFTDLGWAYRFGPPGHDVVVARLVRPDGERLAEDAWFPAGHALAPQPPSALEARAAAAADGSRRVTLESTAFLQHVTFEARGWLPDDDHFHLVPGRPRVVCLRPGPGAKAFRAYVTALNLADGVTVRG